MVGKLEKESVYTKTGRLGIGFFEVNRHGYANWTRYIGGGIV